MRQRSATDIQTKSKRKRFSNQETRINDDNSRPRINVITAVPELTQREFEIVHITPRVAPGSDQRARLAAPGPDMQ
jgi:hypothetical protein